MRCRTLSRALVPALALAVFLAGAARAADRLGSLPIDPAQISVSGISSGAFMANQLHVAHSASLPATLSLDTDPRKAVAQPFDSIKRAILDGQAQSNLLNELVAQTAGGVLSILQNRFLASLDETKAALLLALPAKA